MIQASLLGDSFGRIMRDLRVSITDRCNFRCLYCLPETEEAANFYRTKFDPLRNPHPTMPIAREWKPRSQILSYEEIERLVRLFVSLGIQKVRVTGGEPLLRQGVERLVAKLAQIPGVEDLAMTSNGFLFLQKGEALRTAGLRRISFSMDSLDPANFKKMTGRDGLHQVLASIALAKELDYNLMLESAFEAWLVADELAEAKVSVMLAPRARRRSLPGQEDTSGSSIETSARLEKAGVPFAIATQMNTVSLDGVYGGPHKSGKDHDD
jgi:hypothetical protein